MGSRSPELALAVQLAAPGHATPARARLRVWASAALERDAEVTLRVVEAAESRRLNREFRGRDYATNVLTFTYADAAAPQQAPLTGDVVLCAPVIESEAREQHKPVEAHYAHLVVHAMLHLQGYDHERDDDAARMEARETEIVTGLGYADPYAAAA
jgi:probable rRNA maturation factor